MKETLNDAYLDWFTNSTGFFNSITVENNLFSTGNITWDLTELDIDFMSKYGDRSPTKLVNLFNIETGDRTKLSNYIYNKYYKQWIRLKNILEVEYNPIENYNRKEIETITGNDTHKGTVTDDGTDILSYNGTSIDTTKYDGSESDTTTYTGTENRHSTVDDKTTIDNNVYGYNSTTSTPHNTQTNDLVGDRSETVSYTNRKDNNTTTFNERKDTVTSTFDGRNDSNKKDNVETRDLTNTRNENKTSEISGNIGVTTSQQMIKSEIELWKWNFIDTVFENVANELTLDIY